MSNGGPPPEGPVADVCVILEGTYPYVSGGVSSWVHALIRGLPDVTFRLLFLGSNPATRPAIQYQLPSNVIGLDEFYIHDQRDHAFRAGGQNATLSGGLRDDMARLHQDVKEMHQSPLFSKLAAALHTDNRKAPSVEALVRSPNTWSLLQELYQRYGGEASFVDYYWTFIYTHLPIFRLYYAPVPPAKMYHTISTGYAGFLAALAKERTGRPMIVTEHGIYTHERELEIAQATWIYAQDRDALTVSRTKSFFKQWWIDLFRFFSESTYGQADWVITITAVNQPYQRSDGADPERMRVIPNGIDVARFAALRRKEPPPPGTPFTVGFVGRVVPIKDVKTFLRAMKICQTAIPNFKCLIVGPYEEDKEYYEECVALRENLEIDKYVTFTGKADVTKFYPQFDVIVLTSASEAVPLVILEANCAGIPVVATDVGACREMLSGRTAADQALGPGGFTTPVSSPDETAQAIIKLAQDPALREQMGKSGMARVERFFRLEDINRQYNELYRELAARGPRI